MASMMTTRAAIAVAIGIGAVIASGGALAHDHDPMPKGKISPATRAAHERHENFEKLGGTFKGLLDELKKDAPDKAVLAAKAATISTLANGLPTWFPRGSGVEARPKSEAKANIWTDAAGFSARASALQVQASKMNQIAMTGDVGAIKAQVRPLGGACKACHDVYRQEKKS